VRNQRDLQPSGGQKRHKKVVSCVHQQSSLIFCGGNSIKNQKNKREMGEKNESENMKQNEELGKTRTAVALY